MAGYQSSLREQLGEGEIELRNEPRAERSTPHGIYATQGAISS